MRRGVTWLWVVIVGLVASVATQNQDAASEHGYLFIDAARTRSRIFRTTNFSRIRERLAEAGEQGYGLVSMSGSSAFANLLLKRDGVGPRTYRLIFNGREGGFLNDLNEAASEGFRVVPGTLKAYEGDGSTTWLGIVTAAPDASPATYLVVKGTEDGEKALDGAIGVGRSLVGIMGRIGMTSANTLLFFEEHAGARETGPAPNHRIIANARTSTTEQDIVGAASDGFRLLGAGFGHMTVVMSRSNDADRDPVDYRLLAMLRVNTAIAELNEAGAEGFQLAAMSEHGQEGVIALQRTPGTTDRFEYQLLHLEEETADRTLLDAEADGYRIVALFSDLVVLERPGGRR